MANPTKTYVWSKLVPLFDVAAIIKFKQLLGAPDDVFFLNLRIRRSHSFWLRLLDTTTGKSFIYYPFIDFHVHVMGCMC